MWKNGIIKHGFECTELLQRNTFTEFRSVKYIMAVTAKRYLLIFSIIEIFLIQDRLIPVILEGHFNTHYRNITLASNCDRNNVHYPIIVPPIPSHPILYYPILLYVAQHIT